MILRKENLRLINTSQGIAIASFALGSLLFLLFYRTELMLFSIIGLVFLGIAIPLNSIFLLRLLYELFTTKGYRKQLLVTIMMILINIPVAYVYCSSALQIADRVLTID